METAPRISFHTLGCKLNYSETSSIARQMEGEGFEVVPFGEPADVSVINTCSVTDNADKKCRNAVRRAMKARPDTSVVVIGCYAQLKPKEISEIEGVRLVLGAAEKFRLPEILSGLPEDGCSRVMASDIDAADFFVPSWSAGDRTRSFLKIQDGCDYKCSFCTIPLARGRSRSDTPQRILANARAIAAEGVREIVLTGVNTGDYGKGIEEDVEFFDIVKLLDASGVVDRFRVSSIEPNLLKDAIIDHIADGSRFVPHFHLPLQSGSNRMLGLMRRRYRRELYTDRVSHIRTRMPDACIGVDVIVGFPGETEEEFLETYRYLADLEVAYLHVFTYSERPNTRAAEIPGVVPMTERHARSQRLRQLSERKRRQFYERYIGSFREVLFEAEDKAGKMYGYTDNYIKVEHPYDAALVNRICRVRLAGFANDGCLGGEVVAEVSRVAP